MSRQRARYSFQHICTILRKSLLVAVVATVWTTTTIATTQPHSLQAAPATVATYRTDRRPDRERPVPTQQETPSGFSQNSSSAGGRPRLVRR